jgi:preprotein translocase subunit SecY
MFPELMKRAAFTLGALLVYWLGLRIPLPGVDAAAWTALFDAQSSGVLGQANTLAGGALRTLGILSLSVTPYVTAAILLQLLSMVSRRLRALADDERGRAVLERFTIAITVLLAAFQSYGIAIGLEGITQVVPEPGFLFRLVTVLTLTAGTLFLVWLTGQITARGIGNGVALIIAAGIVNALPREISALLEGDRQGIVPHGTLTAVAALTAVVTVIVVIVERSRRRLPVEFAERQVGTQTLPRRSAVLALKLNPAGLLPSYMASLVLSVILVAATFAALRLEAGDWPDRLRAALGSGTLLHLVVSAALIAFFTFVYTAFVCDPEQMAARLAATGGALPDIAPGEATAAHLDRAISRTAAFGAVYLVFVMLLPEFLTTFLDLPVILGGTAVLVLVCVFLDLAAEIRGYLMPGK